jgi:hypothetical protein
MIEYVYKIQRESDGLFSNVMGKWDASEEIKFNAFLRDMKDLEDQKIKEEDLAYQAESMFAMLKKSWMG